MADGVSSMVLKPTLNSTEQRQALDIDAIFSGMAELSPEPAAQYCPQSSLEPILLAYAREHGSEARYGTELLSFEQHESGVTAVVRDVESEGLETVHADFLVAADGVHSPVRQALGVHTPALARYRSMWCSSTSALRGAHLSPELSDGDTVQVENPSVQGIFVPSQGTMACSSPRTILRGVRRLRSSHRIDAAN